MKICQVHTSTNPSCHECAMECPHSNSVRDPRTQQLVPCGSDVYDEATGRIILCGECQVDQKIFEQTERYIAGADEQDGAL